MTVHLTLFLLNLSQPYRVILDYIEKVRHLSVSSQMNPGLHTAKTHPDVIGHPVIFGILHFTYYLLRHTKSFSGILNIMVVWVGMQGQYLLRRLLLLCVRL